MCDRCGLRLGFGSYRGFYVEEVPLDYLSWAVTTVSLSVPLQEAIRKVLADANYPVGHHRCRCQCHHTRCSCCHRSHHA